MPPNPTRSEPARARPTRSARRFPRPLWKDTDEMTRLTDETERQIEGQQEAAEEKPEGE